MDTTPAATAARINISSELVQIGETRDAAIRAIQSQRYRPDREAELVALENEKAAKGFADFQRKKLEAADAERDRDNKAIDAELKNEHSFNFKDGTYETSAERLTRASTQFIANAIRSSTLMTQAAIDIRDIDRTDDIELIKSFVDDAIASDDPAVVSRVGRAGERRLKALAAADNNPSSPAFVALIALQDQTRRYRHGAAKRSPAAKRDIVARRHFEQVLEIKRQVQQGGQLYGLADALGQAARAAAIEHIEKPASNMIVGRAFETAR